ncbi:MAG: phosphopantothenate/pantothenate synthetase, partial [Thermoplasmata archaeon]|nr:phosphopantothenate/pantothenate synthetase [Thermoplasmata archaeon]
MDIPRSHPRYHSLVARHRLVEAYEEGVLATAGLIAQGRGEAFDYIIGEETITAAAEAERASSSFLLLAERPVLSVNGNVATLCAREIVEMAETLRAKIEVNLFYRTKERMEKVIALLEREGADGVLGLSPDSRIEGLDHDRGRCTVEGIGSADVVLVPLEDGDRCQALIAAGKKVCVVDL